MRPKILFIMHVAPPVHGAAMVGKYIKESKVINDAFETDYINLSTSEKLSESGKAGILKLVRLGQIQLKVIASLFKKDYDLCYVTLTASGPGFYKDIAIILILKLFRTKIIYHFHNKGVDSAGKSYINNLLYKFVFHKVFSIILSECLYYDIAHYASAKNVFFCANGIPENKLALNTGNSDLESRGVSRLLFLGNMMEEKGVFVLLKACKILNEMSLPFECHFVGSWADVLPTDFKNRITDYGLNNIVFTHGAKYDLDKQRFFVESDVFIFPSFYHYESFPLVVIEALQYQLPVISCPEGGIADMVKDGVNGFLVPQRDEEVLADKIKILIEDPELRIRMGIAGRKRYETLFKLETFETSMKDILTEAILRSPGS